MPGIKIAWINFWAGLPEDMETRSKWRIKEDKKTSRKATRINFLPNAPIEK